MLLGSGRNSPQKGAGGFLKVTVFLVFYSVSWILAVPGAILLRLGALGPHLVAKLLQDGAKIAQHSPT